VNPTLPSAAALIDSFLKDLRGIAGLFSGEDKQTIQRTLWCASSTASLTAERDYFIVGVAPLSAGAFSLAAAPTTVANIGLANNASFDVIAAMSGAQLGAYVGIRWLWKAGTKIYLVSTVGIGVVLTLET
jgi:hypothetical protein